jgi:hypothetical protein
VNAEEEVHQQDADDVEFDVEESLSNFQGIINTLFAGTPLSRRQRKWVRAPTTPDEHHAFFGACSATRRFKMTMKRLSVFPTAV